jgi:Mrp family chromosome partitioning ATPase
MRIMNRSKQEQPDDSSVPVEIQAVCRPLFVHLQSEVALGSAFVLGVTSAARGEGRSTVALALATAGATMLGKHSRLLLVDADLQNPMLHRLCGLDDGPGLHEAMMQEVPLSKAAAEITPGLWILRAGKWTVNSTRSLKQLEELEFFPRLGEMFDAVIVDLPPVLTPDLGVLPPRLVPRLVMVARVGSTRRDQFQTCMAGFPQENISAVILNEYREHSPRWLKRIQH